MADLPITTSAGSLGSSGANLLLRFLSDEFISASRNWGGPLRLISNASAALAQKGQTVGIPVAPNGTSTLLTDGSALTLDDSTGTSVNVTLNKQRVFAFSITTIAQAMAGDIAERMKMQSAIYAVLNGVEEDVFSAATSSFTTNTATGTYNTALTEAVLSQSVETVIDQRPPPGPLMGLIRSGTNAWGALMQLSNFVQAQTIISGGAGQLSPAHDLAYGQGKLWHSTHWFLSQAMPKSGTSIDNLLFHPQALTVAMRIPSEPVVGAMAESVVDAASGIAFQILFQWDAARMANQVVVRALYGSAVTKDAWAIQVKS